MFGAYDDYKTGLVQGKAQALYAVINLPQELRSLKAMEDLQKQKLKETQEDFDIEPIG